MLSQVSYLFSKEFSVGKALLGKLARAGLVGVQAVSFACKLPRLRTPPFANSPVCEPPRLQYGMIASGQDWHIHNHIVFGSSQAISILGYEAWVFQGRGISDIRTGRSLYRVVVHCCIALAN